MRRTTQDMDGHVLEAEMINKGQEIFHGEIRCVGAIGQTAG